MVLLGSKFDTVKWFALTLLFFGVTLVQLDETSANSNGKVEKYTMTFSIISVRML
jgi:hypothetical protein